MHNPMQRPGILKVSLRPEPPYLVLDLRGELDLSSVDLVPRDDYASRTDLTMVLLDLGALTFCDVTGLRALHNFRRIHEGRGRSVEVVRTNRSIVRLMQICCLTDRMQSEPPPETSTV